MTAVSRGTTQRKPTDYSHGRLIFRNRAGRDVLPDIKEVRQRRVALGVTQRDLARSVGVSQSNLAKIENGKVNPPYSLARRIFEFLDSATTAYVGKVADIATQPVVFVRTSDQVQKAVKMLQESGYKQLPVKDSHLWVGCLSERSVSRHLMETDDPRAILKKQVGQIMDESLPTVTEGTSIPNVIPLLQSSQAVLVTRQGKVTGIVTNADLLKLVKPS